MEQPPPVLEPNLQETPMSLPARLVNVFATPGEVFQSIKGTAVSTANWLVPAIILIVVSWVGAGLVFSQDSIQQQLREMTDRAIDKQVEKGKLTEQQAEQARVVGAKFGSMGAKIGAFVMPVLVGLVLPFWWGLLLWLVGAHALQSDLTYMKGVEIAGLAGMIAVLDSVIRTLLILVLGNVFASPSLAIFIKEFDPQNSTHTLLSIINIMTFWVLAVRSVGLARITGQSFAKAAGWVFGIWVVQTTFLTGLSLGVQKLFAR